MGVNEVYALLAVLFFFSFLKVYIYTCNRSHNNNINTLEIKNEVIPPKYEDIDTDDMEQSILPNYNFN